ncbi:MAG: hypothetical protein EZS28_044449 [Streblomastix strix]|uniref:Protein kinase domain-containing protein n=1 Tax=Streblomastix strix TaxID=222440 RepID=A0A5J4TNM7_9EUKA|nr:MAG: hypothetical protein EZS28_044449 [Streblomastix strix]
MPKIEDYKIVKKLRGGVMSKTFLVQFIATSVFFVMKYLDYFDPEDKAKADEEISLMRLLDSKFTVHLVETIIQGIQICLVIGYCSGGDLTNTISDLQKIPEKDRMIV